MALDFHNLDRIDFRNLTPAQLKISAVNKDYSALIRQWIFDSMHDCETSKIHTVWDKNVLYLNGYQSPVGTTSNALSQFVIQNWNRLNHGNILKKDSKGDIFVIDNKIPKMFLSYTGEYTAVKQSIKVVKDDYQRNNTIEKAVQKLYDKVDRDTDSWNHIVIPCIENMGLYGVGWEKTMFNPAKNRPYGKVESVCIDPRYVLLPVDTEQKYFKDSRYRIHIVTMTLEEGKEYLGKLGVNPQNVVPDGHKHLNHLSDIRYNQRNSTQQQYVNIYCVEWRKTYEDDFANTEALQSANAQVSITNEKEDRDYYFYAIYTEANGVLHHSINKNTFSFQDYDKFYLTPYYNRQCQTRVHPKSDIEDLINTQDLINVMKTLVINNARKRSIVKGFIKRRIFDIYGQPADPNNENSLSLLQDWDAEGGYLPVDDDTDDIRKVIMPFEVPGLPQEVYNFLEIAEKSFQEQSDTQSALVGDYPEAGPLNTSAIMELQAQKRRKLNFKDININWANSQRAKKLYCIFANDFKQDMLMRLLDQPKGKPQALQINGIMSFGEYEQHLIELGYVDEKTELFLKVVNPADKEYMATKQMLLKEANDAYQEENETHFIFSDTDVNGQPLPPYLTYLNGIVMINMLSVKDRIDINITLDFDSDRDKDTQKVIATNLYERGDMPPELYLEQLGGWFADNKKDIAKYIHDKNIAEQMIAEMEKRGPEFQAAFQMLLQKFDQAQQMQQPQPGQQSQKQIPNQKNAEQ